MKKYKDRKKKQSGIACEPHIIGRNLRKTKNIVYGYATGSIDGLPAIPERNFKALAGELTVSIILPDQMEVDATIERYLKTKPAMETKTLMKLICSWLTDEVEKRIVNSVR